MKTGTTVPSADSLVQIELEELHVVSFVGMVSSEGGVEHSLLPGSFDAGTTAAANEEPLRTFRGGDGNSDLVSLFAKSAQCFVQQQLAVLRILMVFGNHETADEERTAGVGHFGGMKHADDEMAMLQQQCLGDETCQLFPRARFHQGRAVGSDVALCFSMELLDGIQVARAGVIDMVALVLLDHGAHAGAREDLIEQPSVGDDVNLVDTAGHGAKGRVDLGQDRAGEDAATVVVSVLEETEQLLEVSKAELLPVSLSAGDLDPVTGHEQEELLSREPHSQVGGEGNGGDVQKMALIVVTTEADQGELIALDDVADGVQVDGGDHARALVGDSPFGGDCRFGKHLEGDLLGVAEFGQYVGNAMPFLLKPRQGFLGDNQRLVSLCRRAPNWVRSSSSNWLPLPNRSTTRMPWAMSSRTSRKMA